MCLFNNQHIRVFFYKTHKNILFTIWQSKYLHEFTWTYEILVVGPFADDLVFISGFLHFDIFCWYLWDWALSLSAWINKRIGSEGKSAPFEVVPFTEEPFSHHWWTPDPPRIHRFIFNVPPIAQRNILFNSQKGDFCWDRAWYTCDVIWQDFNNIHNYLKYCG